MLSPDEILRGWMCEDLRNRIAINPKDLSVMVYIPAGEVEIGDDAREDRPRHQVALSGYWVGVFAVTNYQYARFVGQTRNRPPNESNWTGAPPRWEGLRVPPGFFDHPVVCVSWEDARAYAEWAGGQLPSEAQWEKAARGPKGLIYPWGERWDPGRCRNSASSGREMTLRCDRLCAWRLGLRDLQSERQHT